MEKIDKHNIYELIGKDRRKYHSALITCYSYDFMFFEDRLLSVLRGANIKNVNVFIDGRYLEHLLENTTGREFSQNKSYTLTPIYSKGVFHPKVMLLLGPKQGLLIVGSGNLTNSGVNSNDEVWGAFHFSLGECEHISLFCESWKYFALLSKSCKGFVHQSFDWIKIYSPWVNDLKNENNWSNIKKNEQITFLYNQPSNGILNQLADLVPNKNLEDLTVISPFYDINGKLLTELKSIFNPLTIHAIIHPELGSIPENLNTTGMNLHFYEWRQVMEHTNRLHAKIFHFKFKNNDEYLLLGSANASVAAFGTLGRGAINQEVSLLLFRNSKNSYLHELRIQIPRNSIQLDSVNVVNVSSAVNDLDLKYNIVYVELEGTKMTIHIEQNFAQELTFAVFDSDGSIIELAMGTEANKEVFISILETKNCFKIAILEDDLRVSNYQLIHRVDKLISNNPDPKQGKLDAYIEEFISGQRDDIAELLSHLSYNWADEDELTVKGGTTAKSTKSSSNDQGEDYEILEEKKFNEISKEALLKQSGILSSTHVRIADFLGSFGSNLVMPSKEEFKESEELKQLQQGGGGEGEQVKSKRRIKSNGEKEQRSFFKFYSKLEQLYNKILKPYYASNGFTQPSLPVTIKSLSNILIALEVFEFYYGKKYQLELEGSNGEKVYKSEEYIQEGSIKGTQSAIWLLVDVLGKFLILSLAGHCKYEYELLQNKQLEMRWNTFLKGIFSVCNVNWSERNTCYRDTLLLNLLMSINPVNPEDSSFHNRMKDQLGLFKNKSNKIHPQFSKNIEYFFETLLPKYLSWHLSFINQEQKSSLVKQLFTLRTNSVIYKKSTGFAKLVKFRKGERNNQLVLSAAGYNWNEEEELCLLQDHPNGDQIIVFS